MATAVERHKLPRIERLEKLVKRALASAAAALAALGGATIQRGTAVTLAGGLTAHIPATITATSRILVSVKDGGGFDPLTVKYAALDAERIIGAPPVGGFIIRAFTAAGVEVANTNGADSGTTIDWAVIN